MKTIHRVALAVFVSICLVGSSQAATTFDVFKASATFTGFVTGTDPLDPSRQILIPYKLSTKQLINLALGRGLKDKVAKNEVLAGAGDAASMASFDLNTVTNAPQRLIVFNTDTATVLATILVADLTDAKVAENRVFKKFKRVGFAKTNVQAAGNVTNGLVDGSLDISATLTRKIVPPGAPPAPKQVNTATGVINLTDAGVAKQFFVVKSAITVAGNRLGQFDD